MEAKKVTITCKTCGQQMEVDFNTAHFSSEIQLMKGKKKQKRTYIESCPECHTINTVTSENKEEWGKRKVLYVFRAVFMSSYDNLCRCRCLFCV